ncbi:conserved hypothetical protein [Candidatus Sulfopaludibacter sp. SbA3]|nr:conserved hypothetical protein [Candidatus Sulfopaludibacter sp. SbA3]
MLTPQIHHAGKWFVHSGIQQPDGGVARYYRADLQRNHAVSTEISGYAISTLVYLHSLTGEERYLERATAGACFLSRAFRDTGMLAMPFETDPARFTYFFDCGIIVRGLLAAWRASGTEQFLDMAVGLGERMAVDFASPSGDFHPVLSLPDKLPAERDAQRWSQSAGCYQLKAAMGWWDLWEATGDAQFREPFDRVLADSLRSYGEFLPGHPDRLKVTDRLHAFCYFLEGLLPRAADRRCAAALCDGLQRVSHHMRAIAPEFERSDVCAQLLRMRLYADATGAVPLDRDAAAFEASRLAEFQATSEDPRIDGGFYFGRREGAFLPYVNPVSTGFSLQALAMWEAAGSTVPLRHLLV